MTESTQNETWQVDVGGKIYEAAFSELGEWIGEGSLLPDDKIRKGDLRWTQAKLVPRLVPFFNAKAAGEPMKLVQTTTPVADATVYLSPQESMAETEKAIKFSAANDKVCMLHSDLPSQYICESCGNGFCKTCPKSYGGTVKICPACGQLCREVGGVVNSQRYQQKNPPNIAGFGFNDFANALAHPFKFKASFIIGGSMFALLTLGQTVSAIGGIFMMVSALFCLMLANTLTFGVLANTVDKFSQGKLDSDFMPSFDDFAIWDDVVHPFFLSIAAYLVSFGPFFIAMAIGLYLMFSSLGSQRETFESEIERIPGTQYYTGRKTLEQSQDVKKVLTEIAENQNARLDDYNNLATGNTNIANDQEAKDQEELWAAAQETRRVQLESAMGKTPETREREFNELVTGLLSVAAPVAVVCAILFIWGAFFFPAACAVAAYTRSFGATINPLVSLDTIKRLGVDYVKILLMGLVLAILSIIVGSVLAAVLSPLDLPGFGNLPAKAIGAFFGFYLSVVFACVIAYALYKNADKLHLHR
jgi:hypothetical protein